MLCMDSSSTTWSVIDKIAARLGASQQARWKWRQRGKVPGHWRLPIAEEARKEGIELNSDDMTKAPERAA
jgi:LDH2 family malate/lactate/ureidoglycolate dehydrogenase